MVLMFFAIINVILSIILSKFYGGIGAAVSTAISLTCGSVVFMNIFYHKKIGINIIGFWKNILKMTIPMLFAVVLAILLKNILQINSIGILIFEILAYVIIYGLIVYKFSMNNYEKQLVLKPINKILKRA